MSGGAVPVRPRSATRTPSTSRRSRLAAGARRRRSAIDLAGTPEVRQFPRRRLQPDLPAALPPDATSSCAARPRGRRPRAPTTWAASTASRRRSRRSSRYVPRDDRPVRGRVRARRAVLRDGAASTASSCARDLPPGAGCAERGARAVRARRSTCWSTCTRRRRRRRRPRRARPGRRATSSARSTAGSTATARPAPTTSPTSR